MVDLNRFDLNLLTVLDALLTERNVTRAAEKTRVSQPSLSGSLRRLREHFNDQLLVRVGQRMELTPKALALVEPVRKAILQIENALEARAVFDPSVSERTFRIATSDYYEYLVLPYIVRHFSRDAPMAHLTIEHIDSSSFGKLMDGSVDAMISHDDPHIFHREQFSEVLRAQKLFEDKYVCVVAHDHPVGDKISLDEYRSYPHVGIHFGPGIVTMEDIDFQHLDLTIPRHILLPSFSALIQVLEETHLIATVHYRLARFMSEKLRVRILEVPLPRTHLREALFWHARNDDDPGHQWLRNAVMDAANNFCSKFQIAEM